MLSGTVTVPRGQSVGRGRRLPRPGDRRRRRRGRRGRARRPGRDLGTGRRLGGGDERPDPARVDGVGRRRRARRPDACASSPAPSWVATCAMTSRSRLAAPWPPSALCSGPSRSRSRPCCCCCSCSRSRLAGSIGSPRPLARRPSHRSGWGAVVAIALPVVAVAAAASILGLPLGLSVLLGSGLIALVGYALAVYAVGRLIVQAPRGRAGAVLAGWGVSAAIGLVPFLNVVVWVVRLDVRPRRGRRRDLEGPRGSAVTRSPPGGVWRAGPVTGTDRAVDVADRPRWRSRDEPAEGRRPAERDLPGHLRRLVQAGRVAGLPQQPGRRQDRGAHDRAERQRLRGRAEDRGAGLHRDLRREHERDEAPFAERRPASRRGSSGRPRS